MSTLNPSGGRAAAVKRAVYEAVPLRWQLPFRYRQMKLTGALEPEMALLRTMVRPGSTAVDVGANHGLYSYALARLGLTVVAFEPQPACARVLRAWARGRVTVHQAGLSDIESTLTLHLPVVSGIPFTGYATFGAVEGEVKDLEVPVQRLDDFPLTDVSFIKIDVEGHELRVVRGALETIRANRPSLLIEVEERHLEGITIEDVFDEVTTLGYQGYYLRDGTWAELSTFDVDRFQRARLHGDPAAPYVNNFLFRPVA